MSRFGDYRVELNGKEHTPEFKDKYRWRPGIEAIMSEFDRTTGVKGLRVRGSPAVRFCVTLKAIGVNLFRATAFQRALSALGDATNRTILPLHRVIPVIKEQIRTVWGKMKRLTSPFPSQCQPDQFYIAA